MLLQIRQPFYLVCSLVILLNWAAMTPVYAQSENPPNVVVLVVDDMRWDDFGAGGHPFVKTPNIDRVAKEGVRFTNTFATTPLCSPARASLLTGQYAHRNGIIDNTERGGHQLSTFPQQLQKTGYETAFVGKWHLGKKGEPRPGFDTWVSLIGQGKNIDPDLYVGDRRITTTGQVTDVLTSHAVAFLEAKRDKPFLLYFAYKAVHPDTRRGLDGDGFIAADRFQGIYDDKPVRRRPNAGVAPLDKPILLRKIRDLPPLGFDTVTSDETIRHRLEMITGVDESVGKLLTVLEANGQLDNTVFVVTSDHGYFYGEHGLSSQRRLAYEESIRIPLVIRYPKLIKAGTVLEQMILGIDLAPTMLELAGQKPLASMQGLSFLPVINGSADTWRSSFLIEHHSEPDDYLKNSTADRSRAAAEIFRIIRYGYKAVRNQRYKYIQYTDENNMDELYDLKNDPYELENLINSPKAEALLKEMKSELARVMAES